MDCLLYLAINSTQNKKQTKNKHIQSSLSYVIRTNRRGVQPVHRSGAWRSQKGVCESLKGSIALVTDVLFWFLFHSLGYVQLFLDMLSEHFAAQEIKHLWKFSSGFIEPQILNFERNLSLFSGPQSSLVPPCKIYLGGPACDLPMECRNNSNYRFD